MSGIYFKKPGDVFLREDGSIQTEAYIAFGVEIPNWLDVRGLEMIDPSLVREYTEEEDGVTVCKITLK